MKLVCKNCNLEFDTVDANNCPRCSSAQVYKKEEKQEKNNLVEKGVFEPKSAKKFVFVPVVDTKENWMKFHNSNNVQQCPACGLKEFSFDWKKREKVCTNCGDILPLRRR